MTRDEFEYHYEAPWKIDGTYLDDVPCLQHLYIKKLKQTKNMEEVIALCKEFRCFAWDAWQAAESGKADHTRLLELCQSKDIAPEELPTYAPLLLPKVMLHATMISREYYLPEFYAGLQYLRAVINWFKACDPRHYPNVVWC